ncbi:MAG: acyl-CoA thioesterase [bacterium]|nr:acyl-CoA thioesterase [bacterium]
MTGETLSFSQPHQTVIKVRGYHCDFYGHVNNARYLEFFEEARWQYLEAGMDLNYWKGRGLGFVVASVTVNYKRPAGPGMELEILSETTILKGRKGVIHQEVRDLATGKEVANADITFAVIDLNTGRAREMEGEVLAGFEKIRDAQREIESS